MEMKMEATMMDYEMAMARIDRAYDQHYGSDIRRLFEQCLVVTDAMWNTPNPKATKARTMACMKTNPTIFIVERLSLVAYLCIIARQLPRTVPSSHIDIPIPKLVYWMNCVIVAQAMETAISKTWPAECRKSIQSRWVLNACTYLWPIMRESFQRHVLVRAHQDNQDMQQQVAENLYRRNLEQWDLEQWDLDQRQMKLEQWGRDQTQMKLEQ